MKPLSTIFFTIIAIVGFGLKMARLNHMANTGEAVSAYEYGEMQGQRAAASAPAKGSIHSNPFLDE